MDKIWEPEPMGEGSGLFRLVLRNAQGELVAVIPPAGEPGKPLETLYDDERFVNSDIGQDWDLSSIQLVEAEGEFDPTVVAPAPEGD